ncbi:MAG: pyridoxal-phosphate dependent enzyme [Planctomycetes bacterium]|nr:pyridoxal-phosphate dependent enzyme [Planctomycetota bacterium]
MTLASSVTIDHVRAAAERLRGVANRTPAVTSRTVDRLTGAEVVFKCENLQRVGAFKFRGAYNAVTQLPETSAGVIAFSSGNHAQGIALAAAIQRVRAVIVMPDNAPATKRAATEDYLSRAAKGSQVVSYDANEAEREEIGNRIAAEEGLTLIPPYDHPQVIAGQGTLALELIEQAQQMDRGPLDRLYVCTGGGGVLSGCATVMEALTPACEVIGVEPELGDDITRSFADRVLRTVHNPPTIADGARTHYAGRYTLPIILQRVSRMETVSEARIARAMFLCLERMRLVVEPTGALALAGLLQDAERDPGSLSGKRVGVVITGGNLDLGELPRLREIAGSGA